MRIYLREDVQDAATVLNEMFDVNEDMMFRDFDTLLQGRSFEHRIESCLEAEMFNTGMDFDEDDDDKDYAPVLESYFGFDDGMSVEIMEEILWDYYFECWTDDFKYNDSSLCWMFKHYLGITAEQVDEMDEKIRKSDCSYEIYNYVEDVAKKKIVEYISANEDEIVSMCKPLRQYVENVVVGYKIRRQDMMDNAEGRPSDTQIEQSYDFGF